MSQISLTIGSDIKVNEYKNILDFDYKTELTVIVDVVKVD